MRYKRVCERFIPPGVLSSPYAFAAILLCRNYEIKRRYRMSAARGAEAEAAAWATDATATYDT